MIDKFGRERAELLGEYVLDTGATVRQAASQFGVSKREEGATQGS